jgi:hypothetical protein
MPFATAAVAIIVLVNVIRVDSEPPQTDWGTFVKSLSEEEVAQLHEGMLSDQVDIESSTPIIVEHKVSERLAEHLLSGQSHQFEETSLSISDTGLEDLSDAEVDEIVNRLKDKEILTTQQTEGQSL